MDFLSNSEKNLLQYITEGQNTIYLKCGHNGTVMPYVDYGTITPRYDISRRLQSITSTDVFTEEDLICLLSDERRSGVITKYA